MPAGHRTFAAVYDFASRRAGKSEARYRQEVVGGAAGRTLELGYGVGSNWRFLPADVEYVGIEPDPYMRKRAIAYLPSGREVTILAADAQALPFEDGSFDTVLATLVFCTIPNAPLALAETRRILRPGGELRFWEHVGAESRPGALAQDAVKPLWKFLGGGCHVNRDTLAAIRAAGFDVTSLRHVKLGPLPAIVGTATPTVSG